MSGLRQLIRSADVRPEFWANGGGATRELWRDPANRDVQFTWRLSLADLVGDASFSHFPGVNRVLLLLEGDGMVIRVDVVEAALSPFADPLRR